MKKIMNELDNAPADNILDSLKKSRQELVGEYLVALTEGNQEQAQALGSKVGIPLSSEEDCAIADALGNHIGTII